MSDEILKLRNEFKKHGEDDAEHFNELRVLLENHIKDEKERWDRIEPYIQGAAGLGLIWKALIAVGSLAMAWAAVRGVFNGN